MSQGGITPSARLIENLRTYLQELFSWNQHLNLTGLNTMEEMAIKHVGDTLVLNRFLPKDIRHGLDIGTGPGVPGLILKIFRPDIEMLLVDAIRKKVSFLHFVIAKIGLAGICAEHGRVGSKNIPGHIPHGGFDFIVSQAVGPLDELARMARPLISSDGLVIAMKGPGADAELEGKKAWLQRQGWRISVMKTQTPVSGYQRNLVVLQKR